MVTSKKEKVVRGGSSVIWERVPTSRILVLEGSWGTRHNTPLLGKLSISRVQAHFALSFKSCPWVYQSFCLWLSTAGQPLLKSRSGRFQPSMSEYERWPGENETWMNRLVTTIIKHTSLSRVLVLVWQPAHFLIHAGWPALNDKRFVAAHKSLCSVDLTDVLVLR